MKICDCEKIIYNTLSEAQAAVLGIWDDDHVKMKPYKCPQGNGFHLATAGKRKKLHYISHGLNSIIPFLKKNKK